MVHEEFVDRQYRTPLGMGKGRPSGPTTLEPAALDAPSARELSASAPQEGLHKPVSAAASEAESRLSPWRAAARDKGRPGYFLAKRCLDCLLAVLCLLLLSPLLLGLALLVRLTSRGPALYRQQRVGYAGRPFVMYKFRSMYLESDESLHRRAYEQFLRGERTHGKVDDELLSDASADSSAGPAAGGKKKRAPSGDPRVTRVGAVLRSSSLDELPQFLNVLRGEMSLVGPRPPIPYEVGLYEEWHRGRLQTLPGITGEWQVHGRSRVTFERMVQMDLEYIKQQTFWGDIQLLLETIPAVLTRKGAL